MRLTCPACGAATSLDAALAHEGAREAVMIALQLPAPLGKLLVQYVALFRPAARQLSLDRLAALLGELLPMIESGRIERGGRVWAAPLESWRAALDDILAKRDKLTLPLKSHGYLLAIIEGYGQKAEGKLEAQQEDRKAGRSPVGAQRPSAPVAKQEVKPRGQMPQTVKAALRKGGSNDVS